MWTDTAIFYFDMHSILPWPFLYVISMSNGFSQKTLILTYEVELFYDQLESMAQM